MSITEITSSEIEPVDVRRSQAGSGHVTLTRAGGRTIVPRIASTSPLKLLNPRIGGDCAWIFTSTYGGGLVGGDSIRLKIDAGPSTRCLLSTQASTKVYRTQDLPCSQELSATVDRGALLVSWPDPIVCFAGAKYRQRQCFNLTESSSLVMIDSLTSGRRARGERWAFDLYQSQTEIFVKDRCIFRDILLLDPFDGALDRRMRMGLIDCFATIAIVGRSLKEYIEQLGDFVAGQPMPGGSLLIGASPISDGLVVRVAGSHTEEVARWIRHHLNFVSNLVGHDPWARKW